MQDHATLISLLLCYILIDEGYTISLYTIDMVTTSPNQNVTVMSYKTFFFANLQCCTFWRQQRSLQFSLPHNQTQVSPKRHKHITVTSHV